MQMVLPSLSAAPTSAPEHALAMFFERAEPGPASSPGESAHRSLIAFAAGRFGAQILGANDRADLDTRVDLVVEDNDFWTSLAMASRAEASTLNRIGDRPKRDVERIVSRMAAILGVGLRPQIESGLELCLEIERVTMLLKQGRWGTPQPAVSTAPANGTPDFLAFLSSPEVHSEIARRVLDGCRAGALSFAIVQVGIVASSAAANPRSHSRLVSLASAPWQWIWAHHRQANAIVAPWLALAIVERWVATLRSFLQFYASLPGSLVPEALIPMNERLDLNRLHAELLEREAFFADVVRRDTQSV